MPQNEPYIQKLLLTIQNVEIEAFFSLTFAALRKRNIIKELGDDLIILKKKVIHLNNLFLFLTL